MERNGLEDIDADEVIRFIKKNDIQIVIVDAWDSFGIKGAEVIKQIKSACRLDPLMPDVGIIAISPSSDISQSLLEAGADDWAAKNPYHQWESLRLTTRQMVASIIH